MKRNLRSTFTACAVIFSAALIAPQVFAHGPGRLFDEFDANKDGKVTRAEAHQKVLEHFKDADANKDRSVTKEEAQKHREAKRAERGNPEAMVEARFKAQDKNKNGKIEKSESSLPERMFTRLDKNQDGTITKEEALEAFRARHEKMEARHKEHKHKGHGAHKEKGHGPKADGHPGKRNGGGFDRIDTSGDGTISEAEAKGAADRVFSRIDANQDNVITRDEASKMRGERGPQKSGKDHAKKKK